MPVDEVKRYVCDVCKQEEIVGPKERRFGPPDPINTKHDWMIVDFHRNPFEKRVCVCSSECLLVFISGRIQTKNPTGIQLDDMLDPDVDPDNMPEETGCAVFGTLKLVQSAAGPSTTFSSSDNDDTPPKVV